MSRYTSKAVGRVPSILSKFKFNGGNEVELGDEFVLGVG